jgi:hypothetical protein
MGGACGASGVGLSKPSGCVICHTMTALMMAATIPAIHLTTVDMLTSCASLNIDHDDGLLSK